MTLWSDLPIGPRCRQALRILTRRCPDKAFDVGVVGQIPSYAATLRGLSAGQLDTLLHGCLPEGCDTQAEKVATSGQTT